MWRRMIVLGFLLLLMGCAGRQTVWIQDGKAEADLKRDTYDCETAAMLRAPGGGLAQALGYRFGLWLANTPTPFEECMTAYGWRKPDTLKSSN